MTRLEISNKIAGKLGNIQFLFRGKRLFVAMKRNKYEYVVLPANLNSSGRDFHYYEKIYRYCGMGGTGLTAAAQLARYIRDLPRLPLSCWSYWESVGVGDTNVYQLLTDNGYADKTNCILCGNKPDGIDWWSLDKLTGPCCTFGKCRQKEVKNVN